MRNVNSPDPGDDKPKNRGRRQFLKNIAAAAGLVATGGVLKACGSDVTNIYNCPEGCNGGKDGGPEGCGGKDSGPEGCKGGRDSGPEGCGGDKDSGPEGCKPEGC